MAETPQGYSGPLPAYYVQSSTPQTPNLGLTLTGVDPIVAYNFVLIDNFASGGSGVTSLNTLTGALTLAAGSNITITPSGHTLTIASTAAGAVTSVGLATGAGAADVLYTISGSPITTSGTITETLNTQTANLIFAGPTTGSAASPTFRSLVAADIPNTTITPIWNNLQNATGALTLANAGKATTFNQTSAVNWTWANTTASTSSTSQSSPIFNINGTYWTGAASATDSWTMQDVVSNGINVSSLLTFTHGQSSVIVKGSFASAISNTVSITVNAGDTVVVLVNNGDGTAPAGITDSGGNTYTSFGNQSAGAGNGTAYYSLNVANSATSVSFTAGHKPVIAVGTYKNVAAIGASTSSATASSGSATLSQALTTTANNSAIVALFNAFKGAGNVTLTQNTATLETSQVANTGTPTVAVGLVDYFASPADAFTTNITSSQGAATGYNSYAIELVAAGSGVAFNGLTGASTVTATTTTAATSTIAQPSPSLVLSGNYWTGSVSAIDKWTIQDVIGNGTNGTSTLTFVHTGSSGTSTISLPTLTVTGNTTINGVISSYNNSATVGLGVPSEIVSIDLLSQTAAITATNITAAAPRTGMYKVIWSATITTADGVSSVLGGTNGFQIVYTSPTDSVTKTTVPGNSVTSSANTTGTAVGGVEVIYAKTATAIQYKYDYTSATPGQMVYELHMRLVAL
jgi:hypothetical protein